MLQILALLTLLLTAADHWTTYLCLRAPIPGFEVSEANPLAGWIFEALGLAPGLLLDSVVTLAALAFLLSTRLVPAPTKRIFLAVVIAWTGYAVVNNLHAIASMGLSPLGGV
ncbi:MAG TPA: DUF5658 family protein [Myxococcota bacterium]|nr:DUF5658 family protein [Myxococcota bacterium]